MAKIEKDTKQPDWATSILSLSERLGLTQSGLGSRLHYSAMAVSRWESGKQEPTSKCYVQLGNLAGEPDCWFFWGRAGLRRGDIQNTLPGTRTVSRMIDWPDIDIPCMGGERDLATFEALKPKMVAIPLLDVDAGALGEPGSSRINFTEAMIDQMIAAPAQWCVNPAETNCLRVKGDSMSPLIKEGDIIAVDGSITQPALLNGKIAVAWHRQTGLALARFIDVDGVQMLESENPEHMPVPVEKDRNWQIVGKVLWWIRLAP